MDREGIGKVVEYGGIKLVHVGKERPEMLLEVSPVFLVPKVDPKRYRMVIDLRRLNQVLPEKTFRFKGLGGFLRTIGRNWWVIVLDLRDGYHHVLMDDWAQRFLGFQVGKVVLLHSSPVWPVSVAVDFLKIMRALIGSWRSWGIYCGNHIDDIWVGCVSKEELLRIREEVIKVDLEGCSLVRAIDKGNWKLMKRVKIYVLIVDTEKGVVKVLEEKIEKV